jgi:hypothetical protein
MRTGWRGIWSLVVKKVSKMTNSFTRGSGMDSVPGAQPYPLGEIASIGLHQPNAGFHDTRWPKVIADPIQGSRHHNFQAPRVVRGSFTVSRVARPTLRIRISTAR